MDRDWTVEIGGKKHTVGLDYPTDQDFDDLATYIKGAKIGKLVIDGKDSQTWKTTAEFPKEISFKIEDKPCVLRKKGLFTSKLDLFLEGKLIK